MFWSSLLNLALRFPEFQKKKTQCFLKKGLSFLKKGQSFSEKGLSFL